MAIRPPLTYSPSVPPEKFEDWARWIDDELYQISLTFLTDISMLALSSDGVILVEDVPNPVVLGIGFDPIIDRPSGGWDKVTGEFIVTEAGFYLVSGNVSINPFGTGNKNYGAQLEIFVNGVSEFFQANGGADDVPLGMSMSHSVSLRREDIVTMELSVIHEQFTGSSNYKSSFTYSYLAAP